MRFGRVLLILCAWTLGAVGAAGARELVLASGARVEWRETLADTAGVEGATARFRFLDPHLRQGADRFLDMEELCNSFALERSFAMVPTPRQIVISLADREVPFGETNPEAVQFFEAFRIEAGACAWESF